MGKVNKTDSCWEWLGSLNNRGYAQIRIQNKCYLGHRISYELYIGLIPDGMVLDHLCSNTKCVNPEHLEPVTFTENVRRGKASKQKPIDLLKKHCVNGHLFSENLYVRPTGHRACRKCRAIANKKYKRKLKEYRDG